MLDPTADDLALAEAFERGADGVQTATRIRQSNSEHTDATFNGSLNCSGYGEEYHEDMAVDCPSDEILAAWYDRKLANREKLRIELHLVGETLTRLATVRNSTVSPVYTVVTWAGYGVLGFIRTAPGWVCE